MIYMNRPIQLLRGGFEEEDQRAEMGFAAVVMSRNPCTRKIKVLVPGKEHAGVGEAILIGKLQL